MTTPSIRARGPKHRRALLTVLAAMIGVSNVGGVWAAAAADALATTASAPASPSGVRTYRLTLKELGAQYPLNLAGVDGTNGVPFGVRADEIVTAARVSLNYAYSPALLPDLSHINVMVNGEVAHSIPVPKEDAGKSLKTDIDLPVRLITDFNRLNLQLIGHYTMGCEDPLHSSLWANVANDSVLELTVAPLKLQNDLALLPLPFFDRRDVRPLDLPFVMVGQPDSALLEAAGTLSSWFGALASYRGARFPVSLDALPKAGNAIVLLAGTATLPGMTLPAAQAPTISLQPNPNDPMGKLLVISGRDAAQVKTAAAALALGTQALSGQTATIVKFDALAPRTPYDAPNWVRSDRPVSFGELAASRDLNVAGYRPDIVRVNLRLPPDLFALRDKGVPVDLKYRYTPRPTNDKSTLNINLNRDFLQSIPLKSVEQLGGTDSLVGKLLSDDTLPADKRLQIPLFMLPPRSQMQLHYYYDYLKQGECRDVIIDNVRGAIDPDSTIDISGYSHFMAMPNLAAFDQAGFPFTRLADLSETAVVLPENPTARDYSAYLALVGRLGESTGYPATAVTVASANQIDAQRNKDLIVIGSGKNQPLLTKWAQYMPGNIEGADKRFVMSDLVYRLSGWGSAPVRRDAITLSSDGSDAILAGFESPLQPGRSVVVVAGNRPEGLDDVVNALLVSENAEHRIEGSLAIIRGKQVDSVVADQTYYAGELEPLQYAAWYFSRHPVMFLLACLAGAALLASLLFLSLRKRAKRRLKA
ncbi:cellulose biosynthesis cyclic di-GMP-binding regulatory protein BcsB [Alcaligenaceae bacterium A4P071]|nr:cellulose biosynthesis cyclic di-GMP-binding regulatory protein BcsB [Alcaligenaceae bacterium A4P071]